MRRGFHASLAITVSLLLAQTNLGQEPADQPAKDKKLGAPKEKYEELKRRLEKDDWVEVYKPLTPRDIGIVAHHDNGKQTKYSKGKLRFTLVVAAMPIDIDAKQPKEIEFEIKSNGNRMHAFETSDGRRELEFTEECPRVIFEKNGDIPLTRRYIISAIPNHMRILVFLQEKVELVDGDNVIHTWFTSEYELAVFAKRTKGQ
jgi:hypothetical protein